MQVMLAYILTSVMYFIQLFIDRIILTTKQPRYRERIVKILDNNTTEEYIENYCFEHNISQKVAETVYLYLHNKIEDVSDILEKDNSTILRRIKKFVNEGELQ